MFDKQIQFLALNGGGIYSFSSLMIFHRLIIIADPESLSKPFEYFDMIGGINTGGFITIIFGRF